MERETCSASPSVLNHRAAVKSIELFHYVKTKVVGLLPSILEGLG
jgi:hypothetical protein